MSAKNSGARLFPHRFLPRLTCTLFAAGGRTPLMEAAGAGYKDIVRLAGSGETVVRWFVLCNYIYIYHTQYIYVSV